MMVELYITFEELFLTVCFNRIVLEVGNRTKSHASDLARQVDILPDDIRNFLQRWIIVQVHDLIHIGSTEHTLYVSVVFQTPHVLQTLLYFLMSPSTFPPLNSVIRKRKGIGI